MRWREREGVGEKGRRENERRSDKREREGERDREKALLKMKQEMREGDRMSSMPGVENQ